MFHTPLCADAHADAMRCQLTPRHVCQLMLLPRELRHDAGAQQSAGYAVYFRDTLICQSSLPLTPLF